MKTSNLTKSDLLAIEEFGVEGHELGKQACRETDSMVVSMLKLGCTLSEAHKVLADRGSRSKSLWGSWIAHYTPIEVRSADRYRKAYDLLAEHIDLEGGLEKIGKQKFWNGFTMSALYLLSGGEPLDIDLGFLIDEAKTGTRITRPYLLSLLGEETESLSPESGDSLADEIRKGLAECSSVGQKYACIVAAPPLSSASKHPDVFSDLAKLPIGKVAAADSFLHLWTDGDIPTGLRLLAKWGFKLAGSSVWAKPDSTSGAYWGDGHEVCLLGAKGKPEFVTGELGSWFTAETNRNGCLPAAAMDRIAEANSGPYLSLWGRCSSPEGWTSFGATVETATVDSAPVGIIEQESLD